MVEPKYLYPRLSLAERDRRWNAVRELLEREHLDCLITPNNTGHSMHFQAESRYLTHCGGGGDADIACVFPLRSEVAAIATSCDRWRDVQNWVTDLREARRAYGAATVGKRPAPHDPYSADPRRAAPRPPDRQRDRSRVRRLPRPGRAADRHPGLRPGLQGPVRPSCGVLAAVLRRPARRPHGARGR